MSARKSKPGATDAAGAASVSRDEIARRAYEIFSRRAGVPGDPTADWLQAEQELRDELQAAARVTTSTSGAKPERRRPAPRSRV